MLTPPSLTTARAVRDLRQDPSLAPGSGNYEQVVAAHLPLVNGLAEQLLADIPQAIPDAALSVFDAFAARWKKLRRQTVIATWLLRTTLFAARRARKQAGAARPPKGSSVAHARVILTRFDKKLSTRAKNVLLLHDALGDSPEMAARALRLHARAFERDHARALRKWEKSLAQNAAPGAQEWLSALPRPAGEDLQFEILRAAREWNPKAPRTTLAAAAISSWRWLAVRRFFRGVATALGVFVCCILALGLTFKYLHEKGHLMAFFIKQQGRNFEKDYPGIMEPAKVFPTAPEDRALVRSSPPKSDDDLYTTTNIWPVKLSFTREQWAEIKPSRIEPYRGGDGRLQLRNPNAKRNGLAGVVGIEFNWTEGTFDIAGQTFTNVAIRYRGNGTWLNAQHTPKRSFKVDLNKHVKGQKLAGVDELNFLNSVADFSFMHDALAERFFRDLGVPAPRTAYAYLTLDVPGKFDNQPLGLYVLVEDINDDYAKDRFGTKKIPIFKPVTYELFKDLGSDWKAYQGIYDVKTETTPAQQERVIEFARLVTHGSDEEFAAKFPSFIDVEEFAAFVAGHVLLSAYDGFLANGQNFYMYLGEDNRFGFISWDQDHSWGEFGYVGTTEKRENASIWQPASYNFRFLDRAFKVEAFRKAYQAKLEHALQNHFTIERLYPQIDALATVIRPAVAAENPFRLQRFDTCVSSEFYDGPRDSHHREGPGKPAHQIKRFIANRIKSVRAQLDGKSEGVTLSRDR